MFSVSVLLCFPPEKSVATLQNPPHYQLWRWLFCRPPTAGAAQRGHVHASRVRSSCVTSAFSNLCLFNLWHYGELPAAVAMPANKLYDCTE